MQFQNPISSSNIQGGKTCQNDEKPDTDFWKQGNNMITFFLQIL